MILWENETPSYVFASWQPFMLGCAPPLSKARLIPLSAKKPSYLWLIVTVCVWGVPGRASSLFLDSFGSDSHLLCESLCHRGGSAGVWSLLVSRFIMCKNQSPAIFVYWTLLKRWRVCRVNWVFSKRHSSRGALTILCRDHIEKEDEPHTLREECCCRFVN